MKAVDATCVSGASPVPKVSDFTRYFVGMHSSSLAVLALWISALCACSKEANTTGADEPSVSFCHGLPDGLACDDGNPCTESDRCGSGTCLGQPVAGTPTCDDGDSCTTEDQCSDGRCVGAVARTCSDSVCATSACDPTSGECVATPLPDGQLCSDGDLCTHDDACAAGLCVGATVACSPADSACVTRVCDAATGTCGIGPPATDGTLCDDDDVCTTDDACTAGSCAGVSKSCSALDAECVRGTCDHATGQCMAIAQPTGSPCDDENPCAIGETCAAGSCGGAVEAPAGTACVDSDPCTENEQCVAGSCIVQPKDCSGAASGDGCSIGECEPLTGACMQKPVVAPGCFCFLEPDGTACNDGDPCTEGDSCLGSACAPGEPRVCPADDNECLTDVCNPKTGLCGVPVEAGQPCADGDPCTVDDACFDGQCTGDNLCVCAGKADGTPCNDKDPCTDASTCQNELCVGSPKDCSAESSADGCAIGTCDALSGLCIAELQVGVGCQCFLKVNGTPCDDGNPCTTDDACSDNVCGGAPKDCAATGSACVLGVCDPSTGSCGVPREDGSDCSDEDSCTASDSCSAGQCIGTDVCFCKSHPDGTECDDGIICTQGDKCAFGSCGGKPIDCSVLDTECAAGGCSPIDGKCIVVPKAVGAVCDDQSPCTEGDVCVGTECAGAPKDCSSLDDACGVGACTSATGICERTLRADGTPCTDELPCTGGDACASGTCVGPIDLCGSCAGQTAGTSCDDADPCTIDTVCTPLGDVMACASGSAKDCSDVAGPCSLGVCDPESGACVAVPNALDTPCDDGDACTENDRCAALACAGTLPPFCGDIVHDCEGAAPNDSLATAALIPVASTTTAIAGRIDPVGETDWYAVELVAGQELTVSVKSLCGSALDTLLGVYGPGGQEALLVSADDGAAGAWSAVSAVPVTETGTYTIGLGAYASSGKGRYIMEITAVYPPPCLSDADCDCPQLACTMDGPFMGKCVPEMPVALKDSATPAQATPVAVGDQWRGDLEVALAADWYRVTLDAAMPVTIETQPFCGDEVQTELEVYDSVGQDNVASSTSGGALGHARIEGLQVSSSGSYLIRVTGEAASTGAYVLSLTDARCTLDADCTCEDTVCAGSPASPGLCEPALSSPEPVSGSPALAVGDRVHATIDEPYDVDTYALYLGPGAWDFDTLDWCGAELDTEMAVYDADGELLAANEDGSGSFLAQLRGVVLSAAQPLRLEVWAYGAGTGDYRVQVRPAKAP